MIKKLGSSKGSHIIINCPQTKAIETKNLSRLQFFEDQRIGEKTTQQVTKNASEYMRAKCRSQRWALIGIIGFKVKFLGCVIGRRHIYNTAFSLWPCQKLYLKAYRQPQQMSDWI